MIGIYGANGFIGRHLLSRLAARGTPVRAVSRHFAPELVERFGSSADLVEASLDDPIAMASSLSGVETVIQLVSTSSPGLGNRFNVSDIRDNVIPHVEFLQNCVGFGVKRYVFVSSGGTVYGPTSTVPIREDHPTNPISSHGLTKLTIENYIRMHGHVDGLDHVILRLANAFGPGQAFRKGQGLIPAVMERHRQGQPVQIIGDGSSRRDYVYIDDVVDALEAAAAVPAGTRAVVNIGSGSSLSVTEVLDAMEDVLGVRFRREHVGRRGTDVDINQLDI
ncbi:MAG: NAD-dependent epimerase/dehydratase family protein, partial [Rhizobiaceae bacterium]|nr:NAD-dependent epimerase/dehydratase family protein [Rhizobiaceae bacterium]